MIENHNRLQGIYVQKGKRIKYLTKSIAKGYDVYGEDVVKFEDDEYRVIDVTKSKLGAAIAKDISQIGMKPGSKVLYLGSSTGTTPSHVSDIVGKDGFIFAIEFAPRMMRDFIFVCEKRKNIAPILEDANHPERYQKYAKDIDVVFQDIAQKNQVAIFLKNCDMFLKKGGFGLLTIKARSIDVTKRPKDIFNMVREELEKKITIVDYRDLDPYEKDHCIFVCKKN